MQILPTWFAICWIFLVSIYDFLTDQLACIEIRVNYNRWLWEFKALQQWDVRRCTWLVRILNQFSRGLLLIWNWFWRRETADLVNEWWQVWNHHPLGIVTPTGSGSYLWSYFNNYYVTAGKLSNSSIKNDCLGKTELFDSIIPILLSYS